MGGTEWKGILFLDLPMLGPIILFVLCFSQIDFFSDFLHDVRGTCMLKSGCEIQNA